MEFTEPTVSDFKQIYTLLKQLWPDLEYSYDELLPVFEAELKKPDRYFLTARTERIAGFISMLIHNNLRRTVPIAYVCELVVD